MQYLVICFYVKSSRHVVATEGPVKRCSSNSVKYSKGGQKEKTQIYNGSDFLLLALLPPLPPPKRSARPPKHRGVRGEIS